MARICLDMGSGNTCRNDEDYVRRMINAVVDIDTGKHEIIFKWQLFESEPPNKPLSFDVFDFAYSYAEDCGYETTSSAFDEDSLIFLLQHRVPYVKIACRPRCYYLVGKVPREIPVYLSYQDLADLPRVGPINVIMACVPHYPALLEEYPKGKLYYSDHVQGLGLWYREQPEIWEKHFVLDRDDPDNPDAAGHATTPEELKEIL